MQVVEQELYLIQDLELQVEQIRAQVVTEEVQIQLMQEMVVQVSWLRDRLKQEFFWVETQDVLQKSLEIILLNLQHQEL
jgi:glycerol-3-phosphate O-acyltransferase